ncbi:MAG: nucleotidyltransferase domain-containing protein [bacterium]
MQPIIEERMPQLRELCRRYHVARLDVFGSAAGERFDAARSDLDFVVEYLPVPAAMTMDAYFGFKEALEHLFEREVDLVERAAVRNPYFKEELDETRVVIYAA